MKDQLKLTIRRLRVGFVITAAVFGIFFLLDLWNLGVCYFMGFLTGCINLFLLTLSVSLITNRECKRPVLLNRLFFITRYLLILNILLGTVNPIVSEIIFFCIGLLNVNFSVIISSYRFRLNTKEEG